MTNEYFQKHTKEESEKKHIKDIKFFLKKITKGGKRQEKNYIEEEKKKSN